MAAMPSPQQEPGWFDWAQTIDHLTAIAAFVAGSLITAGGAIWKLARWSQTMNDQFETYRAAAERDAREIRELLARHSEASKERNENVLREIDHVRSSVAALGDDVRADREAARKIGALVGRTSG